MAATSSSESQLARAITALLHSAPAAPASPIAIGLSGGLDSSTLLAVAARMPALRSRGLRAIHIDHGLQPAAAEFRARASALAAQFDLPLSVIRVQVEAQGQGLEGAAREARMAAFAAALGEDEVLLLAHHQGDQAETLLLRLLRGASLDGLGAMRPWRGLRLRGAGADRQAWIGRPWLDIPRTLLHECATALALRWCEDPANADPRHDRVWLRQSLWPLLAERVPQFEGRLARFAQQAQAAQALIAKQAQQWRAAHTGLDPATLDAQALLGLEDPVFGEVLRQHALSLAVTPPGQAEIARLRREVLGARQGADPILRWAGHQYRRFGGRLYLIAEARLPPPDWRIEWPAGSSRIALPEGQGELLALDERGQPSPVPCSVQVAYRQGGERIQPSGARPRRELRLVLQELAVPPWTRARLPLLWHQGELLAAVGVIASARMATLWPGLRVRWIDAEAGPD